MMFKLVSISRLIDKFLLFFWHIPLIRLKNFWVLQSSGPDRKVVVDFFSQNAINDFVKPEVLDLEKISQKLFLTNHLKELLYIILQSLFERSYTILLSQYRYLNRDILELGNFYYSNQLPFTVGYRVNESYANAILGISIKYEGVSNYLIEFILYNFNWFEFQQNNQLNEKGFEIVGTSSGDHRIVVNTADHSYTLHYVDNISLMGEFCLYARFDQISEGETTRLDFVNKPQFIF